MLGRRPGSRVRRRAGLHRDQVSSTYRLRQRGRQYWCPVIHPHPPTQTPTHRTHPPHPPAHLSTHPPTHSLVQVLGPSGSNAGQREVDGSPPHLVQVPSARTTRAHSLGAHSHIYLHADRHTYIHTCTRQHTVPRVRVVRVHTSSCTPAHSYKHAKHACTQS